MMLNWRAKAVMIELTDSPHVTNMTGFTVQLDVRRSRNILQLIGVCILVSWQQSLHRCQACGQCFSDVKRATPQCSPSCSKLSMRIMYSHTKSAELCTVIDSAAHPLRAFKRFCTSGSSSSSASSGAGRFRVGAAPGCDTPQFVLEE